MTLAPRPVLLRLNAGKPSRSPAGTAMQAALSRVHIARGPAWGGPALGPRACSLHRRSKQ
jgi:hypothetical protein